MGTSTDTGLLEPGEGPAPRTHASPFGPPSPLEPLALAMELGRPVTRGFALLLVAVVLAALGWVDHRKSVRLDTVESAVLGTSTSAGVPTADPQTCYLLGVIAGAQGRTDLVNRLGQGQGAGSDCQVYAARGSRGQDMAGN
jgi:hypothetical protein